MGGISFRMNNIINIINIEGRREEIWIKILLEKHEGYF